MRVLVRNELDLSKPVNLKRLSPLEKVKAGIISQIMQNSFYINYKRQKDEESYMQILKEDEMVKSLILAELYAELNQNRTLSERGVKAEEIIITVDAKYEESLKRLFPNLFGQQGNPHKDFISFNIDRVSENPDIRLAFKNMPILLRASAKRI